MPARVSKIPPRRWATEPKGAVNNRVGGTSTPPACHLRVLPYRRDATGTSPRPPTTPLEPEFERLTDGHLAPPVEPFVARGAHALELGLGEDRRIRRECAGPPHATSCHVLLGMRTECLDGPGDGLATLRLQQANDELDFERLRRSDAEPST